MFKDGNIPDNQCYRDHYIRTTGAHTRYVTKPYQPFTRWESEAVKIVTEELMKTLQGKFN